MVTLMRKIKKVIRQPGLVPDWIISPRYMPDRFFLKCQYRLRTGKRLNLDNPILFNEKIQWLKLYDRKPEYTIMADKYEVRKYIEQTIGKEYLIPLLGVWDRFEDISFEELPDQFVLKSTHDSGGFVICQNKKSLDITKIRNFFEERLSKNFYYHAGEWVYKNIKPRMIAEKLMIDESSFELKDYKIFCFNGEPKIVQVDFNRFIGHTVNLYSTQWEYLPLSHHLPTDPNAIISKPQKLDLMLDLARKLSAGKIHVRVDLHSIENKIYFGELTFYNWAGYGRFDPPEWNRIFGDWMILPDLKN